MGWLSGLFGKESEDQRWERLTRTANTDAVLAEKAACFAPALISMAAEHSSNLRQILHDEDENSLAIEFMFILMHLIDRTAFEQLGAARRNWFVDPLVQEVLDQVSSLAPDTTSAKQLRGELSQLYWNRVQQYSPRNVFAEENDRGGHDLENTIGSAFAELMGQHHPAVGLELTLDVSTYYLSMLKNLNIREFIGR